MNAGPSGHTLLLADPCRRVSAAVGIDGHGQAMAFHPKGARHVGSPNGMGKARSVAENSTDAAPDAQVTTPDGLSAAWSDFEGRLARGVEHTWSRSCF